MGVSSDASVLIGFEVQHSDFWQEKVTKDDFVSCSDCNAKGGQAGKFCSECGGRLGYQEHRRMVANPNFAKWIGDDDPKGRAGEAWDPDPTLHPDEQAGVAFEPFALCCADPVGDCDEECKTYVLALKPMEINGICSGRYGSKSNALDEAEITKLFSQTREFANKLGIDRPVRLYLTTYCSY